MKKELLIRISAFLMCIIMCVSMAGCGKSDNDTLEVADDVNSEQMSDDIPDFEEEEEEPQEEFVEEPESKPTYDEVEKEILSNKITDKDKEKDKSESSVASVESQTDKNIYTGKDYGDTPITRENMDFEGKTVIIMREWEPYSKGANKAWDNFNLKLKKKEKEYNVKIKEKERKVTLSAEMLAGTAPEGHLYSIGETGGNIYEMASKGYLAFLDDAMAATGIDMTASHYDRMNTSAFNFNGKQWSIGTGFHKIGSVVVYNTKLVREAGYDMSGLINSDQWNWDKMTEIAKVATKRSASGEVTQWGIGLSSNGIKGLILSNGGRLVAPESSGKFVSQLSSSATKEALQQAYDWFNLDRVANAFSSGAWSSGNSAFVNGKIAFYFTDMDGVLHAYNNLKAGDYGIAFLPKGPKMDKYVSYMKANYTYVIPSVYQDITTELLLLVDDLHNWSSNGLTKQQQFRDSFSCYFRSEAQFKIWDDMYFSNKVESLWEGSDFVDLSSSDSLGIESIISGAVNPSVWIETNHTIYNRNAEEILKRYKYTGGLK